ncbi:MAG: hypothetical protein JXX14_19890 [Deltaproteobacteria bacterium]|nr:hypothetical protein [Deltaproteobacteria bacterium]
MVPHPHRGVVELFFDGLNAHRANEKRTPKNWEMSEGGFRCNQRYLALSESFAYPEENVILYQHIVSERDGVEVYRFWTHLFSEHMIRESVHSGGFSSCDCVTDVLPPQK